MILYWHNGNKWEPINIAAMQAIDRDINAVEDIMMAVPASDNVSEKVMVPIVNQNSGQAISGEGPYKHSVQKKLFAAQTTSRIGDVIKKLAEHAHTHEVYASDEAMINQCVCQCQCQCQCNCNCDCNCCSHCSHTVYESTRYCT